MGMIILPFSWIVSYNKWKCVSEVLIQLLRQFFLASTKQTSVKELSVKETPPHFRSLNPLFNTRQNKTGLVNSQKRKQAGPRRRRARSRTQPRAAEPRACAHSGRAGAHRSALSSSPVSGCATPRLPALPGPGPVPLWPHSLPHRPRPSPRGWAPPPLPLPRRRPRPSAPILSGAGPAPLRVGAAAPSRLSAVGPRPHCPGSAARLPPAPCPPAPRGLSLFRSRPPGSPEPLTQRSGAGLWRPRPHPTLPGDLEAGAPGGASAPAQPFFCSPGRSFAPALPTWRVCGYCFRLCFGKLTPSQPP